jgi:glycosyltransferase involved in cell wall biosynthesis
VVDDPYGFFGLIDLLVVPSIREPFGNICIEAGLCKVPVLAAYVDGIPEIIENNVSGELIKPEDPIQHSGRKNSLPLPEYVVDPDSCKLIKPMQINPSELADRIKLLRNSPQMLVEYTENLHNNIISNFSIEKYATRLNNIYLDVIESVSALKSL